jgi:hypothetical protein
MARRKKIILPPVQERDSRYDLVQPMVERDKIAKLSHIFLFIPKTRVAQDIGIDLAKMNHILQAPELITGMYLFAIAELCGIDEEEILRLFLAEYLEKKRTRVCRYKRS